MPDMKPYCTYQCQKYHQHNDNRELQHYDSVHDHNVSNLQYLRFLDDMVPSCARCQLPRLTAQRLASKLGPERSLLSLAQLPMLVQQRQQTIVQCVQPLVMRHRKVPLLFFDPTSAALEFLSFRIAIRAVARCTLLHL